jgi:glycerol-3-phosphate acyltransferase PlsY
VELLAFATELGVILGSYVFGCLCTGYYLVRFRTGLDTRAIGSGSAGGANVARVLGVPGFVVTFLGDTAKGAVAAAAAVYFALGTWGMGLVLIAVVAGHIWPVQLGFRGGKGLTPAMGAALVFDYRVVVVVLVVVLLAWILLRQPTPAAMIGVAVAPGGSALLGNGSAAVLALGLMAVLIFIAHRSNIRDTIRAARHRSGVGS